MRSELPITVVIPAYNRERFIVQAIESVHAQRELKPSRILVIDDCSTDGTALVAAAAGAEVIRTERNGGASTARNLGLANVSSDWVAFLDSDDAWLPGLLSSLWPHASRTGRPVSGTAAMFRDDTVIAHMGPTADAEQRVTSPAQVILPGVQLNVSGSLIPTDFARAIGGFRTDLPYSEDLDFWVRLAETTPITSVNSPALLYRRHDGGKSNHADVLKARRAIVAGYESREWWNRRQTQAYFGALVWNQLTTQLRRGQMREVLASAVTLATHPLAVAGALRGAVANRRTRKRYAAYPTRVSDYVS